MEWQISSNSSASMLAAATGWLVSSVEGGDIVIVIGGRIDTRCSVILGMSDVLSYRTLTDGHA